MAENLILSDAIERLVVEDSVAGERIAVITHEDVFTASDNIVVRLKSRAGNASPCSVESAATAALVKELSRREGVQAVEVDPYKAANIACTGPAIVLIVED